ncbi:MAG: type II secretion system F family protein [Cellvibrionales bacterium]|nr:type II secretion system F family protein [Cellvibrionales bacterium]
MAKAQKALKLQTYVWHGLNASGEKVKGELQSQSAAIAKVQLKKKGILPKKVSKKSESIFSQGKQIKPQDIAVFSRQMATMMRAGVPLIQAFDIIIEGAENPNLKTLVTKIRTDVAGGGTLANALREHPKYFDTLFCNLVESGEQSGALETMLDRIATYKEKTEALKSKVKKAMKYPLAVLAVAFIVTGILLIKVVPQFEALFKGFGSDLPVFTRMVLDLSEWVQAYGFFCLVFVAGAISAHIAAVKRSPKYSDGVDAVTLRLPIFGGIAHTAVYARFSRTLGTTFAAGVPLVDALDSVKGAAGNAVYANEVSKIRDEVTTGIPLNQSMRSSGMFPVMMIQMISIGEEAGDLETMLNKLADIYEQQVDDAVDGLTSMMEPLIMAVLGALIGGLMIAMYLPIFMMGSAI